MKKPAAEDNESAKARAGARIDAGRVAGSMLWSTSAGSTAIPSPQ
jgi:hypothetical protein